MSSPLERRYRRVLRLLPVGYRHQWEEDMVAAFMEAYSSDPNADGVTSGRPPLAERLSWWPSLYGSDSAGRMPRRTGWCGTGWRTGSR